MPNLKPLRTISNIPSIKTKLARNLKAYSAAVWELSDTLAEANKSLSVKQLSDAFKISIKKANWLLAIAKVKSRNPYLLPEHHYEVINLDRPSIWLNQALNDGLNPIELRRLIRSKKSSFKPEKKIIISQWPKQLISMESELKRLPIDTRNEALDRIKQHLGI